MTNRVAAQRATLNDKLAAQEVEEVEVRRDIDTEIAEVKSLRRGKEDGLFVECCRSYERAGGPF